MITDPGIEAYASAHSTAEPSHLAALAARTRDELGPRSGMMVGHLEGSFLATLVASCGAHRILEIGTFTGYSALWMASALPDDGHITTCEVSEHHAAIAREAFAGHPDGAKVELQLGPALDTVNRVRGPFDLVFIDADKSSYDAYFEAVLPKLSARGLIVIDNVLWSGRVLGESSDDADTSALKALNDKLAGDPRVVAVMLPVRDGMTLVRRS